MCIKDKKVSDLTASEFINAVANELAVKLKPDNYLTSKEVQARFFITNATIHNWIRSGTLKPSYVGGRMLFLESDLQKIPTDQKGKKSKNIDKEG